MAEALTPPALVAAVVALMAGAAKLRAPSAAADALTDLGLAAGSRVWRTLAVRILGIMEIAVAAAVIGHATPGAAFALAALYAVFAVSAVRLAREHAACGCFGAPGAPVSGIAVALNVGFAALCLVAGLTGVHDGAWMLTRPAGQAAVLVVALLGAAGAAVLAYTELPRAWRAWSGG